MTDANKHINYLLADIQRYLQGSMSAKEMHDLERAALEDPLLADALEGYSEADLPQAQLHVTQIETAIRQQKQESKVIALPVLKKSHNWQVAASIILLVCIAGVTYVIFNKRSNETSIAKTENNSAAPAPDSAHLQMQTVIPPMTDTTIITKKKQPEDKKPTSSLAYNKRKSQQRLSSATAHAPVAITAKKKDSSKAELSTYTAMATQPLPAKAAATITDTQQLSLNKPLPSIADATMVSDNLAKKDSDKAKLSAMTLQIPGYEIAGTVVDEQQQPVPNAMVMLKGTTQGTVTDNNGNFHLPANDSAAFAIVSAMGYASAEKQLRQGNNNIILNENNGSLSEVVVTTALGIRRNGIADTTVAMPQGGWQSLQEYVYAKLHKKYDSTSISNAYVNGDLQLEFSIDETGEPFNFKVLHAPNAKTARKAIAAIKAGPKWISKDKNRVTLTL